jgi:Retinal pigment epithelial membrane protein
VLPFVMDRSRPSRLRLLRKAEPEKGVFRWFEVEPFFAFHTINAWEEGDDTVCVAMCRCDLDDVMCTALALPARFWLLSCTGLHSVHTSRCSRRGNASRRQA